jgi:hypothetical protein
MRTGKPQNPHGLEQSPHTGGARNTKTRRRRHGDARKTPRRPSPRGGGKGEVRATPPSTAPSRHYHCTAARLPAACCCLLLPACGSRGAAGLPACVRL